MTRRNLLLILATTTALSALALTAARARDVPKVVTGCVANIMCSNVSGSSLPDHLETTPRCGVSLIWALDYHVDFIAEGRH